MTAALKLTVERPRVCIVSDEFIHVSRNGGIGTAMSGLAYVLARAGMQVTMLFVGGITASKSAIERARVSYAAHGIVFEALRPRDLRGFSGPVADAGFATPAAVFELLRMRPFDVIHFNDAGGRGHYCLTAKKLGLAFANTLLLVGVHSPVRWINRFNGSVPDSMLALCFDQAEYASIEFADLLWGPSRYLLDWLEANGYRLPAQTTVQQYVMPALSVAADRRDAVAVREIVFFGRLEERKGLRIFCDAVERLSSMLYERGIEVSFMGRTMPIDGIDSRHWIEKRSRSWRVKPAIITGYDQSQALAYLRAGGRLAVMASPADNSPCTVYEAIGACIPFLAAATGGIPELIHPDDRPTVLFDYDSEKLAIAIVEALERSAKSVRPAIDDAENRRRWIELHEGWRKWLPAPRDLTYPTAPAVAVVIFGADCDEGLAQTLKSLSGPNLAVARVLVIGSATPPPHPPGLASVARADLVRARQALRDLMRDCAAPVLFIKAGVRAVPEGLAGHLRGLAASGLDGVIPAGQRPDGRLILGLGHGVAVAFHEGLASTGGLIITNAAFVRGLAGMVAEGDAVIALHDALVLAGAELGASPVAAFDTVMGEGLRPPVTYDRIARYADQAPSTTLHALISVAASVERDGGFGRIARRLGNRIVASRWGAVAPLLARFWRVRRTRIKR